MIKSTFLPLLFLQTVTYAIAPGFYVGGHHDWVTIKYTPEGMSEKIKVISSSNLRLNPLKELSVHYQHNEVWGVTGERSEWADFENSGFFFKKPYKLNLCAKKTLLKANMFHVYYPIGIWGINSIADFKSDPKESHIIKGGGIVPFGLGCQISWKNLLIDVGGQWLWSWYRVSSTKTFSINLGYKLTDFSEKLQPIGKEKPSFKETVVEAINDTMKSV